MQPSVRLRPSSHPRPAPPPPLDRSATGQQIPIDRTGSVLQVPWIPVPPAGDVPLTLTLLGSPTLLWNGQPLALARRQLRGLLYRLAATTQPISRDQLCFLFWPDIADSAARRNLTVLLNQLRQALPVADVVQTQGDHISLRPRYLETDTIAFAAALTTATQGGALVPLAAAVANYAGPFLDGFTLPASVEFDAWIRQERQAWERRYLDAAALIVNDAAARGATGEAIAVAQRALAVDPLAEELHRRLITLYASTGDRRAALRQYEACVMVLERELGVSPLPETRAVYEAVRQGQVPVDPQRPEPLVDHPHITATPPAPPPVAAAEALPTTQPHTLPVAAVALIGRQTELAAIRAHLTGPNVRLLTLTGTGGSGKTQLALQAAWDVVDHFADGAVFVALAPVRDPELVVSTIGQACGLTHCDTTTLATHLRDKALLLVLDNCEHLLPATPAIATLLAAAPRLRVLATSRTPLNLQGEHRLSVPPLPLPDLADLPPLAQLAVVPAVALLLERTQAVNPTFHLTAENAAALAAICVRLDGLPLALELAAARLKLLAPHDLARRLERRLALLTHGPRDAAERQQTLRATIDWSYRLLDVETQLWFERCSLFVGGWTLAALEGLAAQLYQGHGGASDAMDSLLDVLDTLTNNSLVQIQLTEQGEPRFVLLETIREFAAECLAERGATAAVAQAHADYYLGLVEGWDINAPDWLTNVEVELDNLRAALRWYLGRTDGIEQALRLAYRVGRFCYWRDWLSEGRWWLEGAIAHSQGVESEVRANVLNAAALQATVYGDTARALELHAEALQLCERLNLGKQRTNVLTALATLYGRKGETARAIGYLEEACTVARQIDNPDALCNACYMLAGILVEQGDDIARALRLYEECLTVARAHQRPIVESMTLASLGVAYALTGNLPRAAELLPQALQMQEQMNATMALGWTHQFLGILALLQHDNGSAAHWFMESLDAIPRGGTQFIVPLSLEGLAGVLSRREQPARAAQLLGAADALRATLELPHPPIEQTFYLPILVQVQAQLTADAYTAAWQCGRQLPMSDAIAGAKAFLQGR